MKTLVCLGDSGPQGGKPAARNVFAEIKATGNHNLIILWAW